MPAGDGTGPSGKGPRTGRGLGTCPPQSDSENSGTDIRPRGGRGIGRGRRRP